MLISLGTPAKFEVNPDLTDLPYGCMMQATYKPTLKDITIHWIPNGAKDPPSDPYRDFCYTPKSLFDGKKICMDINEVLRVSLLETAIVLYNVFLHNCMS